MDNRDAATGLIQSLVESWNRGDREAFAGLFTAEANYLTSEGEWRQGRAAIAGLLDVPDRTPRVRLDGPVEVRDHGTVLTGIFHWTSEPGVRPGGHGLVTCVMLQQEGRWQIDILQNTDIVRER